MFDTRDELAALHGRAQALIANDPALSSLAADAHSAAGDDPAHDLSHCLRVADWTLALASPIEPRSAIAAALLHDIVNVPKDSRDRAEASARSAQRAKELLEQCGFSGSAVAEICLAIRDHSYSRGAVPETALGRALQDADRLDGLGALGMLRAVSTGARMGSRYFDCDDPWAEARELDDRRFVVDHFFQKLFRLPALMHTEGGRKEAHRRADFLRVFLHELGQELGQPPTLK
jgi:uncharacterized protein